MPVVSLITRICKDGPVFQSWGSTRRPPEIESLCHLAPCITDMLEFQTLDWRNVLVISCDSDSCVYLCASWGVPRSFVFCSMIDHFSFLTSNRSEISALLSSAVFVHVCQAFCPIDWVEWTWEGNLFTCKPWAPDGWCMCPFGACGGCRAEYIHRWPSRLATTRTDFICDLCFSYCMLEWMWELKKRFLGWIRDTLGSYNLGQWTMTQVVQNSSRTEEVLRSQQELDSGLQGFCLALQKKNRTTPFTNLFTTWWAREDAQKTSNRWMLLSTRARCT